MARPTLEAPCTDIRTPPGRAIAALLYSMGFAIQRIQGLFDCNASDVFRSRTMRPDDPRPTRRIFEPVPKMTDPQNEQDG